MKKNIVLLTAAVLLAAAGFAGETSKLTKTRRSASSDVVPGYWHADLAKCRAYAQENNVPLIAVWSNGDLCGHCVSFESACNNSAFVSWMRKSGYVFYFACSSDKFGQKGGTAYKYCWGSKKALGQFPFVRMVWTVDGKTKVDTAVVGDATDGSMGGSSGAKKAIAYFSAKFKGFSPYQPDPFPYTITFDANGGSGEMASAEAMYGTAQNLPMNQFVRSDYAFSGWAKTATGTVAYKDLASVKNLTTKTNATEVTLYARWTRLVYGTYYTGVKKNIRPTNYAGTAYIGYAPTTKIPGMAWSSATGIWSGTPTKAGTYAITFKKGTSSFVRTFVVEKDEIRLPGVEGTTVDTDTSTTLDSALTAISGGMTDVKVAGLPDGLTAVNGVISGRPTKPGVYTVTVTGKSVKNGQSLKTVYTFDVKEGDALLLNGLAHADEMWALAGDSLSYQVMAKVKKDGVNRLYTVPEATIKVTDEDGVGLPASPLSFVFNEGEGGDETGRIEGVFPDAGVYTVVVTTMVDDRKLSLTFTVQVCEQADDRNLSPTE